MSHVIHKVAFGPEFPGQLNPLDGFQRINQPGSPPQAYKYFLKVSWALLTCNGYIVHMARMLRSLQQPNSICRARPFASFCLGHSPHGPCISQSWPQLLCTLGDIVTCLSAAAYLPVWTGVGSFMLHSYLELTVNMLYVITRDCRLFQQSIRAESGQSWRPISTVSASSPCHCKGMYPAHSSKPAAAAAAVLLLSLQLVQALLLLPPQSQQAARQQRQQRTLPLTSRTISALS